MKTPAPLLLSVFSLAALPAGRAAVDFEKDVKPILEVNCVRCHNPKGTDYEEGRTDVDLSTKAAAFEVASTIVPGNPEKSKIYTTTILPDDHKKVMPPPNKVTGKLERIAKEQSDTLKLWITEGANWPADSKLVARKADVGAGGKDEKALVSQIHARIVTAPAPTGEKEMQPYTGVIAGTEVKFDMLPIPGGKYKMGSPDSEAGRKPDEGPQHEVELAPFWMGKFEVTWNEFELFMYPEEEKKARAARQPAAEINALTDATTRPTQPYVEMSFGMGKDGFPAISMTQHAANKYCEWLSAKTGQFYRLPTEAEWEYAARAGTDTAYFWGDDPSKIGDYCWWGKNSDFKYQKVGKKKPNPWGLYDILGNVIEWTLDQYDPAIYAKTGNAANPWNKASKPYPHVARGGSWDDDDPAKLRVAARRASDPTWKIQDPQLPKSVWYHTDAQFLGFRVVRPLKTPTAEEMFAYWNSGVEKDIPGLNKGGPDPLTRRFTTVTLRKTRMMLAPTETVHPRLPNVRPAGRGQDRDTGGKCAAMSLHRPRALLPLLLWALALAGWIWLVFLPVGNRTTRSLSLLLLVILYFGALRLIWRWKWARWTLLLAMVAAAVFLVLPGRDRTDLHALRSEYVRSLLRYRGVAYVRGGESWKGIDSSGLIRRGLIESAFARGLRTLDPSLTRAALSLWWRDDSTRTLVEWQREITDFLFDATSLNELDHRGILPGDLAVMSNGSHILAYVGDRTWIEADPNLGRIITIAAPAVDNPWFTQPVRLFRWQLLRR